jgi:BirA family transcriptional regulator, biotin operon repressor / biotin---[acetyl-CoA-carboxylase] ligase
MDTFGRYLEEIERLRPAGSPSRNLVVLSEVDSTNSIARKIIQEYEVEEQPLQPLLILAREQRGGRGRLGRSWASPAGKGIYATRVVSVQDPAVLQTLPLLVGIGLSRGLGPHVSSPCRLKWPNDLLVEGKKIGGILIESMIHADGRSRAIIGFGVNVGHSREDLPARGTSVRLLGRKGSVEELTWSLVEGLERELAHLGDMEYAAAAYRGLSVHRPGDRISCRVGESVIAGTFVEIDDQGRLVLESAGRELRLASGEVLE